MEEARLAKQDSFCQSALSESEKRWLQEHRPPEAAHWNLLTDLSPDQLRYEVDAAS